MASVDVIKCCVDSIRQISDDIKDAIVCLDAGSAESFQFLGAFPLFLELGAVSVCRLENISSLDKVTHSAYPDSPLGPDAFNEYETLLVQDYEEVVKKYEIKSHVTGEYDLKESTASEDEGWSQLTSIEADTTGLDGISSTKIPQQDFPIAFSDDVSQQLIVSVHHFPLTLCAMSPRVSVLPSEGFVAEGFLSSEHENSISSGLPPLRTGSLLILRMLVLGQL